MNFNYQMQSDAIWVCFVKHGQYFISKQLFHKAVLNPPSLARNFKNKFCWRLQNCSRKTAAHAICEELDNSESVVLNVINEHRKTETRCFPSSYREKSYSASFTSLTTLVQWLWLKMTSWTCMLPWIISEFILDKIHKEAEWREIRSERGDGGRPLSATYK